MKRHLNMKQFKLMHNALVVMAAELANVEDRFHQRKQYIGHGQMQFKPHSPRLLVVFLFV